MAKLTTNWTNRDRTRFTNCKYTVLPQIGIKKQIRDVSERGQWALTGTFFRSPSYQVIFLILFKVMTIQKLILPALHPMVLALKSKRLLTTLTMGCFSEVVTLLDSSTLLAAQLCDLLLDHPLL